MHSIKEISARFAEIDRLIIEILNCAAEDFLGLNTSFKEIYAKSTLISNNAEDLFSLVGTSYTTEVLQHLEKLYKQLSNAKRDVTRLSNYIIKLFNDINEILNSIDLHNKNINQNLLTLKFLLTNLKITGLNYEANDASYNQNGLLIELNRIVNNSKLQELEVARTVQGNIKIIAEGEDIIRKSMRQVDQQVNQSIEIINEAIQQYAEKIQEHQLNLPKLEEQNGILRSSIDSIITNLQYHDIIRQKIEHVQISHKELLKSMANEEESMEQAYLNRVGELVNIQSALLVRANKEYQKAIEQIIDKFKAIKVVTANIITHCKELKKVQKQGEEFGVSEVIPKLTDVNVQLSKFFSLVARVNNIIITCKFNLDKMIGYQLDDENTKKFANLLSQKIKESDFNAQGNIIQQIETVAADIISSRNIVQTLHLQLNEKSNEIDRLSQQLLGIGKSAEWDDAPSMVGEIVTRLRHCDESIIVIVQKNLTEGNAMGEMVNGAIGKVKYYQVFDVKIIEIIKQLNHIYAALSGKDESQIDKDDVDFLQKLYTMESERQIHNRVVNGFGKPDSSNEQESDESEIEFF